MDFQSLIKEFFEYIETHKIELYNEFSFQHELGIFLREKHRRYSVQFERNVSHFNIKDTIKKEIDIVIYDKEKENTENTERYAIELKYPRHGQYPERMFKFVQDIKFMEQLKEQGFKQTCVVALVEQKSFYTGKSNDGIYEYFRGGKQINGVFEKPTGFEKGLIRIDIKGKYDVSWESLNDNRKYYCMEIK